jgi:hypothetical protein
MTTIREGERGGGRGVYLVLLKGGTKSAHTEDKGNTGGGGGGIYLDLP